MNDNLVGAVSNCAVSTHAPMWSGWKSQLPGWTAFGAVANRTYRAWGKYRITDLFSETSYRSCYKNGIGFVSSYWVVATISSL